MSADKNPARAWEELGLGGIEPSGARRPSDRPPSSERGLWARYRTNLLLFLATSTTVFFMGGYMQLLMHPPAAPIITLSATIAESIRRMPEGWVFAVPLLAILLAHEFGHYIAARIHGVPASLPYFLPMPFLSPFGTLGAVILMPERIRSRNALLDIGASGPIAGMLVALPVMAIGLQHSELIRSLPGDHVIQEGQSLLYWLMKRCFVGEIPAGYDVNLHPTAFAGWGGFLVTMINLLPVGQLDGGHIAYALFDERQNRFARWLGFGMLGLFAYNLGFFLMQAMRPRSPMTVQDAIANSLFWLMWFGLTRVLLRLSGGVNHPTTEPGALGPGRKAIGWISLILFLLLFMTRPFTQY